MDLVVTGGGVLQGRLPIRASRFFPLALRSLPSPTVAVSAAVPGCACPCQPIVRRNGPAVVRFAKKRKGHRDDPPEAADDLVDELEEEEVVEEEDFDDDDEGGNGLCELR